MTAAVCQGCGEPAGDFQCPLCQAEGFTDKGYYCTQACFTKHWLEHRDTVHKGGSVREKKKPAKPEAERGAASASTTKASKRARDEADTSASTAAAAHARPHVMPWPALPNTAPCRDKKCLATTPALPLSTPKAVIVAEETSNAVEKAFWPLVIAAAGATAAALAQDATLKVLVVAGNPQSAHAFAWAARCAGLSGQLRLAVSEYERVPSPAEFFTRTRRVVVASHYVVQHTAVGDTAGAASCWLPDGPALLVTLPDVANAEDLQAVHHRALFCAYRHAGAATAFDDCAAWTTRAEANGDLPDVYVATPFSATGGAAPQHEDCRPLTWQSLQAPAQLLGGRSLTGRLDNEVSTALANGDIAAALEQLTRVYGATPGYYEEILLNSLACDWAAMSVTHAHHRLAHAARVLVARAREFNAAKGASIADATFRVLVPLCRLLPPIGAAATPTSGSTTEAESGSSSRKKSRSESKKSKHADSAVVAETPSDLVPTAAIAGEGIEPPTPAEVEKYWNYYHTGCRRNLQLQATLHHWMDHPSASTAMLDALAGCWGISRCLEGGPTVALHAATKARSAVIQRLRSRYQPRLGDDGAAFLVMLMHFVYDAVAIYSLGEQDVEERLLWNLTIAQSAGPLSAFLEHCQLAHEAVDLSQPAPEDDVKRGKKSVKSLSSRGTTMASKPLSRTERLRVLPVRAATVAMYVPLKWRSFPLSGERQREIAKLHHLAVEEILMAMPSKPRPMYVGEIGNLVGKWFRFNARYDGVLGVTLQDFLVKHPEEFTVAGLLVTRRKAGRGDQVRIRFDDDDFGGRHGDDSDDEDTQNRSRKARDRELLTGGKRKTAKQKQAELEKNLPSRARKRMLVKQFNSARFNRNYKPLDPSAKVPGYIKRGPREIKGRGKKANKRNTKRS